MAIFILNNETIDTEVHPGTTVLDFVRYHRHLKGTKIGCREGDCGACTVLIGELINNDLRYRTATSCLMPIGNAHGKHIVTIEGINDSNVLTPVQQAMADEGATQCGFCTPGFVMSLTSYCLSNATSAVQCIDGNICRCTGYKSIERAALSIEQLKGQATKGNLPFSVSEKIVPQYFEGIQQRLAIIEKHNVIFDSNKLKVGGGTDLYVQRHDSMHHSEINFMSLASQQIIVDNDYCEVGAACTITDLLESAIINQYIPRFAQFSKLVSSTPIRNMATLAGNFVNASPIGDLTILFLALESSIFLASTHGIREIPLRAFYKGYKQTDIQEGEYIIKIKFPLPSSSVFINFEKVSKRTHLDIASVNSAMKMSMVNDTVQSMHISVGGVFAYPLYLFNTSQYFVGKTLQEINMGEIHNILQSEIAPISDARGSAQYKRLLAQQLLIAHLHQWQILKT